MLGAYQLARLWCRIRYFWFLRVNQLRLGNSRCRLGLIVRVIVGARRERIPVHANTERVHEANVPQEYGAGSGLVKDEPNAAQLSRHVAELTEVGQWDAIRL